MAYFLSTTDTSNARSVISFVVGSCDWKIILCQCVGRRSCAMVLHLPIRVDMQSRHGGSTLSFPGCEASAARRPCSRKLLTTRKTRARQGTTTTSLAVFPSH